MLTNQEVHETLVPVYKKHVPKIRIVSKQTSWLHRTIGKILKRFGNKYYMENYFTTIGYTVAYPGADIDYVQWSVYPHECGHAVQAKRWTRGIFGALYLMGTPVYLIPAILISLPFFICLPWWSGLIPLGTCALLCSPVPFGGWRARWEFQQYGLSIALRYWTGKPVDKDCIDRMANEFTSSAYFWMYPYTNKTKTRLQKKLKAAVSGNIFKEPYGDYYADVYKALKRVGLITKPAIKEP